MRSRISFAIVFVNCISSQYFLELIWYIPNSFILSAFQTSTNKEGESTTSHKSVKEEKPTKQLQKTFFVDNTSVSL